MGLNNHPSPLNALYRLRMIILGKNPGVVSTSSNTSDNNQEEFIVAKTMKHINDIIDKQNNENIDDSDTDTNSDDSEKSNINEMTEDAVEYLAGWVANKYRQKFPKLGCTTTKS